MKKMLENQLSDVVVHAQVGKEFPNTRQNERRIEFIRVGEEGGTASTMGQLPESKGELTLNVGLWSVFIVRGQGTG